MPLPLLIKELEIYVVAKKLAFACYELTQQLPAEERGISYDQIRKAALSLYINASLVTSCTDKKKRRKHLKMAKHQLIIIDAAIAFLQELHYLQQQDIRECERLLNDCYKLLKEQLKNK